MPAYDFRCTACSHVFEVTRSSRDDSPVPCPVCGGTTKQVFHAVGVHFKGSGFHNTDYPKSRAHAEEKTEANACPATSGGGCEGCPASE
jgi:putative FmdB family regulatory protein